MSIPPIAVAGPPVQVATGPRGRGIASVSAEGNVLRVEMTDGQVHLIRLPILEGGGNLGGGMSADVLEAIEAAVAPLALQEDVTTALGAKADTGHHHVVTDVDGLDERLTSISDAMAGLGSEVVTSEEVANAIAALQIADYLKIGTAAQTYSRLGHHHVVSEVDGLQAAIDQAAAGSVDLSTYATTAAVNQKITDLNIGAYLKTAVADMSYATKADVAGKWTAPTSGTVGDVLTWDGAKLTLQPLSNSSFVTKASADQTYALKAHSHAITDVTGLQAALDAKAASTALAAKQDTLAAGTSAGQVLTWDGAKYAPAAPAAVAPPATPYIERFAMAGALAVKASVTRAYNVSGAARTITRLHAAVGTPSAGSAITAALKVDGTQVGTVNIAAGASTGSTTLSANWPADSYLTVDVTAVGSTTAGADLVVSVRGV